MANMTFPTGNTGSAPTAARTSNLLLDDGTNTGSSSVATVLGLINQGDVPGFKSSGSTVNYISVTGGTTGNGPTIASVGSDTDVGITIAPQANGPVAINAYTYINNSGEIHGTFKVQSSSSPYVTLGVDATSGNLTSYAGSSTRNFVDANGYVTIGGAPAGPVISSGSGVPSGAPPNSGTAGSLYLRTGGGANTSVYVYYSSAWHAITG